MHEEVGPARTTVAEVARRAGVTRVTVYTHFPEDRELFAACQGHWLAQHPPPALDPADGLEAVLAALYPGTARRRRWPRTSSATASGSRISTRFCGETGDALLAGLAQALGGGPLVGARARLLDLAAARRRGPG